MERPPEFADILDAAAHLEGKAVRTPLLESMLLNEAVGGRILVKPEALQHTGSFKFRGAYNRISRLDAAARAAGVVAYSSGNHAQGVAAAARLLGAPATIVMPADAPAIKVANTKAYGAQVVLYDRETESREEIGHRIAAETGTSLVKPYDDPYVIAGQGTVGLEIAAQAADAGAELDAVLSPCGGGGLISGTSLALKERSPATDIYAVEPEGFDDTTRSLAAGSRQSNDPAARSFCDALLAPTPGEITFEINRRTLAGGLVVSEAEVGRAMSAAFRFLKIVVEPGGAVALAAVLSGKLDCRDRTVAVVCSGGHVDHETYRRILAAA